MSRRRGAPVDQAPELDLRLAVGAAAAWVAVLSALGGSAATAWWAAAGSGAGGVVALASRLAGGERAWARWSAIPAVALLCASLALLALGAELHRVRDGPLAGLAERRAGGIVEATVRDDPRVIGGGFVAAGPRVAVGVLVTAVRSRGTSYRVRAPAVIIAGADGWLTLLPGQRLRLDGRLAPSRGSELAAATITARGSPELIGQPPWWQRLAAGVRADLQQASAGLPAAERGLLPGLVDGDTSNLDPVLREHFRVAGLTHLVAVSGTNCMIVVGAVLLVLKRFGVRRWLCAIVGALTLIAFVVVARPSPSVVRAAVMASVVLVALALGRPRQGLPALSFAVLVLLAWRPGWARDAGFAMSVLATGALLMIAPGWAAALRRRHFPPVLAEGVAVAAAASAITAPIVVLLSGQVSLVSLPANVLAELAVAPATVLGVLAAVTAPISLPVGAAFADLAGWPCRWLVGTAEFFGTRNGAVLAWPGTVAGAAVLAVVTGMAVLALRRRRLRWPLLAGLLTFVVIQMPVRSFTADWPVGGALLVACDVGQGDAFVLPVSDRAAVVVDSGPEPVAVDRCLRSLGISRVLVYVQSHFDLDHVGGLPGLVRGREIGLVITGPLLAPPLGRGIMTRTLTPLGIHSQVAPAGTAVVAGRVRLDVLASRAVEVDGQPESNNSSLIVRATVAGRRILLLGDAEQESQQLLLASRVDVRADILKVAHHGSANFDPDLYAAVHARLGVISVGAHNPYGHPSSRALRSLADLGVPVVRTDQDGDVAVLASPDGRLRTVSHHPAAVATGSSAAADPILSAGHATMESCPPRPTCTPASSSSSVTRTTSSIRPSSRSPPLGAGRIRTPTRSPSTARASPLPSCTRC